MNLPILSRRVYGCGYGLICRQAYSLVRRRPYSLVRRRPKLGLQVVFPIRLSKRIPGRHGILFLKPPKHSQVKEEKHDPLHHRRYGECPPYSI